jgi:transcriptional regulator with XRE-family HTH domain
VGEFIRAQRQLGQLSLRELADRARVSNPYLSQLERGMYQPSAQVLRSIARALGVNPGTMFTMAGFLDDEPSGQKKPSIEQAISLDPRLTPDQKRALMTIYRSFLAETP